MAAEPHAALRASSLLRDFSDVGLRLLAEVSEARVVGRGAYAFRAGEPSSALIFVTSGILHLVGRDGGTSLGEVGPGDTVSGFALLGQGGEHLVSALAATEVSMLLVSREAFEELQRARPRTALKLTLALARDLAERMQDARVPLREFLVWQISKRQNEPR
jgi:CRP-like cAMP-binding protein